MMRTTPELVPPSPNFRTTPVRGHLAHTDLTCTTPAYTAVLRWNWFRTGNPPAPMSRPYHQGHHGPIKTLENFVSWHFSFKLKICTSNNESTKAPTGFIFVIEMTLTLSSKEKNEKLMSAGFMFRFKRPRRIK
ncbi:hypothetical protein AVEN_56407-1 [Araneus ventricosus]|uniref:Uncharacterized protein n=1 Tax=Araneus ventricosus TaxID=182803 RepID=A0A4Y2GLQ7_ARAVE|nr:hypothetical protein AVEN_56407-1 [Araneus ventricosus]